MNQKELTKTVVMIKMKKIIFLQINSALQWLIWYLINTLHITIHIQKYPSFHLIYIYLTLI